MASRSRRSKLERAVMTLRFDYEPSGDTGDINVNSYIDLSQVASVVNRRFYRQGLEWAVASFELKRLGGSGNTGHLTLSKVQNTWSANNAWMKAFSQWNRQQKEALEEGGLESAAARYRDFKIYLDTEHRVLTFGANKRPRDNDGNLYLQGEWEASEVVIPNDGAVGTTNEYSLMMHGSSIPAPNGTKSILDGYAFSRSYPQSPDPVSPAVQTGWMSKMFDVGDDDSDIIVNAVDKNDDLPYDQTQYPGQTGNAPTSEYHDQMFLTGTTISGTDTAPGGTFQCGLIKASLAGFAPNVGGAGGDSVSLIVNLVPGPHRGYMAQSMQDA